MTEITAEGCNFTSCARSWLQLYDLERVCGMLNEMAAIDVSDHMVGKAPQMKPSRECECTAFGSSELLDLRKDDGSGVDGWGCLHGPRNESLFSLSS
jgi:hypothetical protein